MTAVIAIKLINYRLNVAGGYELLSGWGVRCASTGKLFSTDGVRPWLPVGGKSVAMEVQASGVLSTAKFVEAA